MEALAITDGWGQDNERLAQLSANIHNSIMIAISKMPYAEVKKEDFRDAEYYLPRVGAKKKKEAHLTVEQWEAIGKQMAGLK